MTFTAKFARSIFYLATFLAWSSRAADVPSPAPPPGLPEGARMQLNIAYVPNGGERQTLDLYLPATGTNWPLIVWIHGGALIMGNRNGVPSHLAETSKQLDMNVWPAPIIRQFLGELSGAQTMAAAADVDPKKQAAQICEANFYGGELALLKKDRQEAARLLKLAAKDCPQDFVESTAAIAETIIKH